MTSPLSCREEEETKYYRELPSSELGVSTHRCCAERRCAALRLGPSFA